MAPCHGRWLPRRQAQRPPEDRCHRRCRRRAPDMMGTLPDHMKLIDLAGSCSLTFECGDLPADVAVFATGHVPNGYFREGVAQSFTGGLLSQAELDPEAGMFCARGSRAVPGQLRDEPEGTSTTPRGSPGSSGRQRPPASSSTTEHTSPRSISGRTGYSPKKRRCMNIPFGRQRAGWQPGPLSSHDAGALDDRTPTRRSTWNSLRGVLLVVSTYPFAALPRAG